MSDKRIITKYFGLPGAETLIQFKFLATNTAPALLDEIFSDNYEVIKSGIEFRPGDVILDIGANEGMFSILMSRCFPQTRILAYEPVPTTFETFRENIKLNGCENIEPFPLGVGKSGRMGAAFFVSKDFSGGSTTLCTFNEAEQYKVNAPLTSLDNIFEGFSRCRLMKMDIEGMEYEALYFSHVLSKTDYMVMEAHMNNRLDYAGRRVDGLINWVGSRTQLIHVDICKMAE